MDGPGIRFILYPVSGRTGNIVNCKGKERYMCGPWRVKGTVGNYTREEPGIRLSYINLDNLESKMSMFNKNMLNDIQNTICICNPLNTVDKHKH